MLLEEIGKQASDGKYVYFNQKKGIHVPQNSLTLELQFFYTALNCALYAHQLTCTCQLF